MVGVGDGVGEGGGFGGSSGWAVGAGVGDGVGVAVGEGDLRGVGVGDAEMFSGAVFRTCVRASPETTKAVATNIGPIFFNIQSPYSDNTAANSRNDCARNRVLRVKSAMD
jgi:hypothetical protein